VLAAAWLALGATACTPAPTPPPPPVDAGAPDAGAPLPERACVLHSDCIDVTDRPGPCERAVCIAGESRCAIEPLLDGTPCSDEDACTTGDVCQAGVCAGPDVVSCDDGNPCTDEVCDRDEGCVASDNTAPCEDGNPCTEGDVCAAGACVSGTNECPCLVDGDCAAFEDADLCNGSLVCATAGVQPGCFIDAATVVTCEGPPAGECLEVACAPGTGQCGEVPVADGTTCGGSDLCVGAQSCTAGACGGGVVLTCDDDNPCTDDVCLGDVGCVETGNATCGECEGLGCLSCAYGNDCAPGGVDTIDDTCCAEGDNLVYLGSGTGAEVVDVQTDGRFAFLCGGFGVRISNIESPASPVFVGSATQRCQNTGIGPLLPDGRRVFYLTHHGDTWVPAPFLATLSITPGGEVQIHDFAEDASILFEGAHWLDTPQGAFLYVAAHRDGVRVYSTDANGLPAFVRTISGFTNATRISAARDHLYVADGEGGLRVLELSDPANPTIVQTLATTGIAKDSTSGGGRIFVAAGGGGVDVFDAPTPDGLTFVRNIPSLGSSTAVATNGSVVAVADWTTLALYDAATLQLIGTEDVRSYPSFEQVFGVAMDGDIIYAGEWVGLHTIQYVPGLVAPDIHVEEELLSFDGTQVNARAVIIRNRGLRDLLVTGIATDEPERFVVDATLPMTIPPGGADSFEVTFRPPEGGGQSVSARVSLSTNDPDPSQSPLDLFLIAGDTSLLNVGDSIDYADFQFLSTLTGGEPLEGNVLVLAYFALF
jgi:hypothetical protein